MTSISTEAFRLPVASADEDLSQSANNHFPRPLEISQRGESRYETSHPTTYTLDLAAADALARLRPIAVFWPEWPAETRQTWLQRQEIALPPRALSETDIAILPGGAVTLRGPDGILLCDPADAVTLSEAEARQLRTALRRRTDATHLLHLNGGVVQSVKLPIRLPPQAVTIAQDASRLPGRLAINGPVLIQWSRKGAVAWPMVQAPAAFALAASVAAMPVARQGQPLAAEQWHAPDVAARCRLLGPGIAEHAGDLLTGEVPDELSDAMIEACVAGPDGLLRRIAAGLAMLPTCFQADASVPPGGRPTTWRSGIAHIERAAHAQALLGLGDVADPVAALRTLRGLLDFPDALIVTEISDIRDAEAVPLRHDAAAFLVRRTQVPGRIALIVPVPAMPVDLYALAGMLADSLGTAVTAIAPCWGFCHRIDANGAEAGNAGWFGMGAGLNDMDVLIGED
jgi:hypothetical protein